METVFDHNITPEEWKFIGPIEKRRYLAIVDVDNANRDIAALYYHRGNMAKFQKYADLLPVDLKLDLYRTVSHP